MAPTRTSRLALLALTACLLFGGCDYEDASKEKTRQRKGLITKEVYNEIGGRYWGILVSDVEDSTEYNFRYWGSQARIMNTIYDSLDVFPFGVNSQGLGIGPEVPEDGEVIERHQ